MECHEIGERFEHNGVVLEVVKGRGNMDDCKRCSIRFSICTPLDNMLCGRASRLDGTPVYFRLIEQCKSKDMEQKTETKVEGTDKTFATQMTNNQSDEQIYGSLLDKLFTMYKSKNADYGSAFAEMFDELGIDYAYGKLREKMNRIKVLRKQPNMVENEGLEDALLDTAGYAILTLVELKKRSK